MMMSACSPERQDQDRLLTQPAPDGGALHKDVHLGLQMCRANSLSLTRLQLALRQDDRHGVLEAVDRLHDLDTRFGRLLQRLAMSANDDLANDDLEAETIGKYIDEQSMAVAFARLALVSEVSGPDMASPTLHWGEPDRAQVSVHEGQDQPASFLAADSQFPAKVLKLVLAFLVFAAVVGSILFAAGF